MSQSAPAHPADRLLAAIEVKRSPVCVGIDPVLQRIPGAARLIESTPHDPAPIDDFVQQLLAVVCPFVPCVKFQSACYERFGQTGVRQLESHIVEARQLGMQVILDAKRGDIGLTAEHYADGAFNRRFNHSRDASADWLTINSYLGEDAIAPFLRYEGHGSFALVRTSNPGGDAVQNLRLIDGRTVAQAVGELIAAMGLPYTGKRGYSALGAVVGATKPEDAKRLRTVMPHQIFLVPGYGAQGGGVDDVLPCFKPDGTGAIVNASRSVIYAFSPKDPKWMNSVADAAAQFAESVGRAVGMQ